MGSGRGVEIMSIKLECRIVGAKDHRDFKGTLIIDWELKVTGVLISTPTDGLEFRRLLACTGVHDMKDRRIDIDLDDMIGREVILVVKDGELRVATE
jgi:hypothetical protein